MEQIRCRYSDMQQLVGIEESTPVLTQSVTPPPGYVAWSAKPTLKTSRGLSRLMVTLYWAASLGTGLLALAYYSRLRAWRSMWSTNDDRTLADTVVLFAAMLQIVLMLAAMIATGLWSKRIASNAAIRDQRGTNPAWTAVGWFVPLVGLFVGFHQLRRIARNAAIHTLVVVLEPQCDLGAGTDLVPYSRCCRLTD